MAAYDNVDLPGSPRPANYAPPLLDFSALGKLAKDYQEGQQYGVQRDIQTSFRDQPMPTDPKTGQIDYSQIASRLLQIGGPQAAAPYLKLVGAQQASQDFNRLDEPGPPTSHVASGQPTSGPGNITGGTPSGDPGSNPAPNTLRGLLTAGMGPQDSARLLHPAMNKNWATMLGGQVGPDDPLSDAQVQAVIKRFPQLAQTARQGQEETAPGGGPPFATGTPSVRNPQQPNTNAFGPGEDILPPNSATSSRDAAINGPTQAGPQPVQSNGRQPATPSDPQIARQQEIIKRATAVMNNPMAEKNTVDAAAKRVDAAQKAIEARTKFLNENAQDTTEEKNTGVGPSTGSPMPAAVRTKQLDASEKTYAGLRGLETQYITEMKPATQTAKGILTNPKMYAGFGAEKVLDFEKLKAALGGDPDTAALQEALQKVTAINLLSQVSQQRAQLEEQGQQSGRIFQQQIEAISKASSSVGNTIKGNLFLVNYQQRIGETNNKIAEMARTYRRSHGNILDDGFDAQVARELTAHPIFTPQEQANPLLLSSPDAPASIKDKAAAKGWATSMGLKTGDSIRLPNGSYASAP